MENRRTTPEHQSNKRQLKRGGFFNGPTIYHALAILPPLIEHLDKLGNREEDEI
jgi:hypothetical protein